jgi:hypothetical protein
MDPDDNTHCGITSLHKRHQMKVQSIKLVGKVKLSRIYNMYVYSVLVDLSHSLLHIEVFRNRDLWLPQTAVTVVIKMIQMGSCDTRFFLVQVRSKIFKGVKILSHSFDQLFEAGIALGAGSG